MTKFIFDDSSATRNMLIYCIYGYTDIDKESWVSGIKALSKYANSQGCNQIVAYSNLPTIINIVKRLGGNADYTFLTFDVNKILKEIDNE